jgi:hypothetical protein
VSGLRRSLRVPFVLLPLVLLAAVSGCGSVASGSTAEAAGGTVANPTGAIKGPPSCCPTTPAPVTGRALAAVTPATRSGDRDTAATGGTITFTQMDATSYAGSYDLYFGTDHMTGSFLAPWC